MNQKTQFIELTVKFPAEVQQTAQLQANIRREAYMSINNESI